MFQIQSLRPIRVRAVGDDASEVVWSGLIGAPQRLVHPSEMKTSRSCLWLLKRACLPRRIAGYRDVMQRNTLRTGRTEAGNWNQADAVPIAEEWTHYIQISCSSEALHGQQPSCCAT